MGDAPVIAGTGIHASLILNLLAVGYTFDRVVEAYPILTASDITAAPQIAERLPKPAKPTFVDDLA